VALLASLLLAGLPARSLQAQDLRVGYGLITPDSTDYLPAASAVFGFRDNNVLISEAGVPSTRPTKRACTYAVVRSYMDTGVAIANPNDTTANITMEVRDIDGGLVANTLLAIPGHQQTAQFISQVFRSAVLGLDGTIIVMSDQPVATVALRQRKGLIGTLFTALPMVDLDALPSAGSLTFPHFAAGGDYETEIILINPGDDTISGSISCYQQDGKPANVLYTGTWQSHYAYSIPPAGIVTLVASTDSGQTISGYAVATNSTSGGAVAGLAIFTQTTNFVPVSEASVPVTASTHRFRILVNESARRSSGLAIANPSRQQANLLFTLNAPSGPPLASGSLQIPAGGQIAKFVQQILDGIEQEVPAILEVSSDVPIFPLTLRLTVNEHGDTLLTTLPVADLEARPLSGSAIFPQIALGDGWNTEVILIDSGAGDQKGSISFFKQDGSALSLASDSSTLSYQLSSGVGARYMTLQGSLIGAGTLGPAGGTIAAAGDQKFVFPPGQFRSDTRVSLGSLTKDQAEDLLENDFASQSLTYVAGFAIDTSNASYQKPLLLSFANIVSSPADTPILIIQVVPDLTGDGMPDMVLADVGVVRGGRIEGQSIATLPGIQKDGSYLLLSSSPTVVIITGQVTNADGSPAVGAAVTSLEQPGIFALADLSGSYTLAIPVPQSSPGSSAPDLYAAAVPLTVHLVAASPGLVQLGFMKTSVIPGPGIILIPTKIGMKPAATADLQDSLCSSPPEQELIKKFQDWLKKVKEVIDKLTIPSVPYNLPPAPLDCQHKSVQLTADLQSVLTPEKLNPVLANVLASKITLTKTSLFKTSISRNIQILDFQIVSFAAQPSATSSNPAVANVTSNTISGNDVITAVQAVASGSALITGGVLHITLGFKLDYSVEASGEVNNCPYSVKVSDNLALDIDRGLNPIVLGPATVTVGDLTSCTPSPPPTISVKPTSFAFTGKLAGPDPPAQTLQITNIGPQGSKLNYTFSLSDSWLHADGPLTGLASGESSYFSVSVSTAGLSAGTYSAAITIADSKASNSPVNIAVTLTITSTAPSLQVNPASLSFSAQQGASNPTSFSFSAQQGASNPASQLLAITSTGTALSWSGGTNASWLSITPSAGTTPSNTNVAVSVAGLSAGVFNGSITLTAAGAGNSPLVVPVRLTITGVTGNSIQVNPASFSFNAQQGIAGPPSQTMNITSTGGALNWSAASDSSWLSLTLASGTTPAAPSVSAVIAGLSTGTYSGRITITAAGATNSPVAIPVSLLITSSSTGPLTFTVPSPLPSATVQTPYQFSFCQGARLNEACGGSLNPATSPTGGQPPYHFQLGSGVGFPPQGLVLDVNGRLSGTPTTVGTYVFSVCAVDLSASQVCQTVSLTVNGSSSFSGPFSGSAFDSKTFEPSCVMKHSLSGTITLTVSGSGTAADPYTGTVSGSGRDDLTVASGTLCYGDVITAPITGTVSGSSGKVQALATASGAGTTLTIEFTNGVISGNTLTGTLKISNEFFDAPITGPITLTRAP
jgi:hypothetical protein